jgi:small conductance mechanosensitive channel
MQDVIPDLSTQTVPDSIPADSISAIGEIGEGVRQLGELVVNGEWALVWDRIWGGAVQSVIDLGPRLLAALFVGVLFYGLYRIVFQVSSRLLRTRSKRESSALRDLVLNTVRFLGLSFVVLLVLAQLGLDITAAVAGLGILGLALGFAAKESLENFLAGLTIILDRPFDAGDIVEIDGTYGTVNRFTLRSTRIRTVDHRILVVPNARMINEPLLNHSALRFIRVDIPFGIAYKEKVAEARAVVLAAIGEDDRFIDKLEPQVVATGLGESSVDMELRLFVERAADELPVRFEYVERVREALRDAGIEIPFPHLQLFIDEAKAFENGLPRAGGSERSREGAGRQRVD